MRSEETGPGAGPPRRPTGPTRRESVRGLERELASVGEALGIGDPRLEAERLVAHVLGVTRAELARTGSERIGPSEARRLARAARRRLEGEPLQHIEGTVHFRDLVLTADGRALIPRPETEQLVDRIEAWTRRRGSAGRDVDASPGRVRTVARRRPSVDSASPASGARSEAARSPGPANRPVIASALDIGTGSGAIALSLVREGLAERVLAIDVDRDALEQAADNRDRAGVDPARVELRLTGPGTWSSVNPGERFDLIVSNPPYVRDEEVRRLPVHIREHEPHRALAGGADGLDVIREIVAGASDHLRPGGALFLEIGEEQGPAVLELLGASGAWGRAEVLRDLSGRDRFVIAEAVVTGGAR